MPLFAHAEIELEDGSRIKRGQPVPADFPDLDALLEGGAVSEDDYDPANDVVDPPDVIEIEGVTYIKASEGAQQGEESNA